MAITMSAKLFLERAGLRPTYRRPVPTTVPDNHPIHDYPVSRPLPPATQIRDGFPPPDRGSTQNDPWHLGPPEE